MTQPLNTPYNRKTAKKRDLWQPPKGIVLQSMVNESRLYNHRQRSLATWERGFDDIDYAFPGQR